MSQPRALSGGLTTPRIVFLVVSAAAPLVAMVGTVPISVAFGVGAGVPALYLLAAITLGLFTVGYAAMAQRITNAGGFYTYVARGIGRPAAAAGGVMALVAYNALAIALAGGLGYFAHVVFQSNFGIDLPWQLYSGIGIALVGSLGYRNVDLAARLIGILMLAELLILTIMDIAIVAKQGLSAFPLQSFNVSSITHAAAPGVAMMFAFGSFAGFESAALYGEESRNPRRTIPRATFGALTVIAIFYVLTSWIAIGAVGASKAQSAAGADPGSFMLGISGQYVGDWSVKVMSVLVVTSLLASLLASHNASSRYMFALGRERMLPRWFGQSHLKHGSPSRASLVQTCLTAVVVAGFALAGLDPYRNLVTSMSGLSTIGILVLQALAALAVIAYFRRTREIGVLRSVVAPGLGLIGLLVAAYLTLKNYDVLAGTESTVVNAMPYFAFALALVAVGYAVWLRSARPEVYAGLGGRQSLPSEPEENTAQEVTR